MLDSQRKASIKPGVSIITLTHNNNDLFEDFIDDFLFHNTYHPFEIIVNNQDDANYNNLVIDKYRPKAFIFTNTGEKHCSYIEAIKDSVKKAIYPNILFIDNSVCFQEDILNEAIYKLYNSAIDAVSIKFKRNDILLTNAYHSFPIYFFLFKKYDLKCIDSKLRDRQANITYSTDSTSNIYNFLSNKNKNIYFLEDVTLKQVTNEDGKVCSRLIIDRSTNREKKGNKRSFQCSTSFGNNKLIMQQGEKTLQWASSSKDERDWRVMIGHWQDIVHNYFDRLRSSTYLKASRVLISYRKFDLAERLLRLGRKKHPLDLRLVNQSAYVAKATNNWSKLINILEPTINILGNKTPDLLLLKMSLALCNINKFQEADTYILYGMEIYPYNYRIKFAYIENAYYARDWEKALSRWEMLKHDLTNRMTANKLCKISKIYHEMGEYEKAEFYLQQGLEKEANNRLLLLEEKNQLFALKMNKKWEESRGDVINNDMKQKYTLPDWLTLINKCKYLLSFGDQHNFNQYKKLYLQLGRSHLFWADELFSNNEIKEACNVLIESLDLICSGLPKTIKDNVIFTIKSVRCGYFNSNSFDNLVQLINTVKANQLRHTGWLFLNDLLIWNGLMNCSLVARQKAINRLYEDAITHPNDVWLNISAARGAIDSGDLKFASNCLKNLSSLSEQHELVKQLFAYYDLFLGNTKGFSNFYYSKFNQLDMDFYEYVQGKTVAVVGSAQTEELSGSDIDSYDLVLRFNYYGPACVCNDNYVGAKTNINMLSNKLQKFVTDGKITLNLDGVKYCLVQQIQNSFNLSIDKNSNKNETQQPIIRNININNNKHFFYKGPTAGTIALFDLLKHNPKRIKLFKTNFHLSEKPYPKNNFTQVCRKEKYEADLSKVQLMSAVHDHIGQLNFVRNLWIKGLIDVDDNCASVLKLSNEQYMKSMEQIYL